MASDGSDIALMGETLRVYDATTYVLKSESEGNDANALGLDFDGRGGIVAVAIDGKVLRFDTAGTLLTTTESPFGHLRNVLITDDHVWVAGNEGIARASLDAFIAGNPFDEVVRIDRPEGRGRYFAAPTGLARHPTTPLLAMGGSQQPLFFDLSADALVE